MAKLVLARVTTSNGLFINDSLHPKGSVVRVDLDALGIKSLDEVGNLEPADEADAAKAEPEPEVEAEAETDDEPEAEVPVRRGSDKK